MAFNLANMLAAALMVFAIFAPSSLGASAPAPAPRLIRRAGPKPGAAMAPAAHRIPAYKAAAPGSAAQRMAAYRAAALSAEPGITFLRRGPIFQAAAPAHAPKPSAPRRIPAAKAPAHAPAVAPAVKG
ncbi:g7907 [Coccomyxa elongata]